MWKEMTKPNWIRDSSRASTRFCLHGAVYAVGFIFAPQHAPRATGSWEHLNRKGGERGVVGA
ncbi:hypothetical protein bcgnr5379_63360 [Bacillus cereus]